MAGQGVKEIISTAFSPSPYHASVFPVLSDTKSSPETGLVPNMLPSPSAAPALPNHSLPTSMDGATAIPVNPTISDGEWEEVVVEPLGTGSRKRKHPDREEGGLNHAALHRGHGVAFLRDYRELSPSVRVPDKLICHPFLFLLEAAKLQVLWHILQRNDRDILADALHEILSIRLHKDYAISVFFNADSLDENYPERNWEYWHLLGEEHPQSIYLRNFDTSDNSSDSGSMGGLEYPPSEGTTPSVTDNSAVPGHHEPCRDLHGIGPVTITLRNDNAVPVDARYWICHGPYEISLLLNMPCSSDLASNSPTNTQCLTTIQEISVGVLPAGSPGESYDRYNTEFLTDARWADLDDDEFIFYLVQLFNGNGGEHQSFMLYQHTQNGTEPEFPDSMEWESENETEVCPVDALYDDGVARHIFTMYKQVDKKIRPVSITFSPDYEVRRKIPEDPMKMLPELTLHQPAFQPTPWLDHEQVKILEISKEGFLSPEEEKLFIPVMELNQRALAFEDTERGTFKDEYFSPYKITMVPHVPWEYKSIPIPPGILQKVIDVLKLKTEAGIYEMCQSSYCSRWFCVLKKNGKLCIVHDLQPLNKVSIWDAAMLPIVDDFVEGFAAQCWFQL
ncbi:hypothetical protein K438DRAFT_1958960 [Mycena galopus ATCC 62051]|nr:hypothetical protein K438DRAFT_1958960 [Mycena galopus ATCC 62051]